MEKFMLFALATAFAGVFAHADVYPYTCRVNGYSTSPSMIVLEQTITGVGATADIALRAAMESCATVFRPEAHCEILDCSNAEAPPASPGSFVYDGTGVAGDDTAGAAASCQHEANQICARSHNKARAVSKFNFFGENGDDQCSDWSDANTCTSAYYTYAEAAFVCN